MHDNVLTFRNHQQVALWKLELVGQLSDGNWENSAPHDHWEPWSKCAVGVGSAVGRNFYVKRDSYQFADPALLEVCGTRMLSGVRLATEFGLELAKILVKGVDDDSGKWKGLREWVSLPDQAKVVHIPPIHLHAVLDRTYYGWPQMIADLNDMSDIVRLTAGGSIQPPLSPREWDTDDRDR